MPERTIPFDVEIGLKLQAAARRAACQAVKSRARAYARRPLSLEAVFPDLAMARAPTMIAIAEHLLESAGPPARWFGFGGEVNPINARAVLLLGRTLRRTEGR